MSNSFKKSPSASHSPLGVLGLLLMAVLMVATSCKSKRIGTTGDAPPSKHSYKKIQKEALRRNLDAEWVDAKADVRFEKGKQKLKAQATLRMRKDSVIWMAVRKFGIEGARLLATPDSVFLINRLERTYLAQPVSYLREMSGMPSTGDKMQDFRLLYHLLLGDFLTFHEGKHEVGVEGMRYKISKLADGLLAEYQLDGQHLRLREVQMSEAQQQRRAVCSFGKFRKVEGGKAFSEERRWNITAPDFGEVRLDMDFSNIKLNHPTRFPFSIPKRYKEVKRM